MAYKVSVCMTTYNQEKYIVDAIESVVTQRTTFPVQLVIGEDCSTDNTADICKHYASLYPNISLVCRRKNIGLAKNFALSWLRCKGKYIAILEGDDVWCSKSKLETQVAFMESHPEYPMCFTRTEVMDKNKQFPHREGNYSSLGITDIIRHNLMANCSVLYRRGIVPEIPYWMMSLPYCDLALHCLHLQHGSAAYIPETTALLRLHSNNSFEQQGLMERVRVSTEVYQALSENLPSPYAEQAKQTLLLMYQGLALWDFCSLRPKKALQDLKAWATLARSTPLIYLVKLPLIWVEELRHLWRAR